MRKFTALLLTMVLCFSLFSFQTMAANYPKVDVQLNGATLNSNTYNGTLYNSIYGTLATKRTTEDSQVFVLYRVNGGEWQEFQAYFKIFDFQYDDFEHNPYAFSIDLPSNTEVSVEFKIKFVEGDTIYWDDNNGENYLLSNVAGQERPAVVSRIPVTNIDARGNNGILVGHVMTQKDVSEAPPTVYYSVNGSSYYQEATPYLSNVYPDGHLEWEWKIDVGNSSVNYYYEFAGFLDWRHGAGYYASGNY